MKYVRLAHRYTCPKIAGFSIPPSNPASIQPNLHGSLFGLANGAWLWRSTRVAGRAQLPPKAYCNNPNEIKCTVNISNCDCFKDLAFRSNNMLQL